MNSVYRAVSSEVRSRVTEDGKRIMSGHFSVTGTPYEIDSVREGRFLETVARGAFAETLAQDRSGIKVLLEHGKDPQVADKPLGRILELGEDERGAFYSVELLDTSYVRDLIPALEAGIYSASFRFAVEDEVWNEHPKRSEGNPEGLPERSITRLRVMEFGPVLWPANPSATAMVRSLTDKFGAPEERAKHAESRKVEVEPATADMKSPSSGVPTGDVSEVRDSKTESSKGKITVAKTVEERRARITEIAERLKIINDEHGEAELPEALDSEYAELRSEAEHLEQANTAVEERRALVTRLADAGRVEATRGAGPAVHTRGPVYDATEIRKAAYGGDSERRALLENAERVIERADYAASNSDAAAKAEVVNLLRYKDKDASFARRVAHTASPEYRRAFSKWVAREYLEPDEQRAMALGNDADGGFGVPHELDPTIILTSGGAINPLRELSRVERITGKTLQLVTSAGVTVTRHAFSGEGVPTVNGNPKLAREEFNTGRVSAYLEETIEIEAAYAGLDTQLTRALMEAKEEEESLSFVTATGDGLTNGIQGLNQLNALGSLIDVAATGTLTYADIFGLDNALKPRHRRNAKWLANNSTYNKIRLIDENSGGDLWSGRQGARPATINDHDAFELSDMTSQGGSTTAPFLIYGDFQKFAIVDRIGMVMDRVPVAIDPTTGTPNGRRGLAAFWWSGAGFIDPNAFRGLKDDGV